MSQINREAAIEAFWKLDVEIRPSVIDAIIEMLKQLPPAQPEIVRCVDCKHWLPHYQLGYDEDNNEYHDYCNKLIPEDEYYAFYRNADDFCSRAERRNDDVV